jgi:hypothetical protein
MDRDAEGSRGRQGRKEGDDSRVMSESRPGPTTRTHWHSTHMRAGFPIALTAERMDRHVFLSALQMEAAGKGILS